MAKYIRFFVWLIVFPILIFGESVIGLPVMSIFLFLLLTLRLSVIKRIWWLLYVSGWLALCYHTWWWQSLVFVSILLIWTKVIGQHRWIFGWLIIISLSGAIVYSLLFDGVMTSSTVLQGGLHILGSSLIWWWLWRRWGSVQRSSTWYIR